MGAPFFMQPEGEAEIMSEEIDYAARVQRGIALMDEKWPDWAMEIDLEALDIQDSCRCVTAQYSASRDGESDWAKGRDMLDLTRREYDEHGFNGEVEDGCVPDQAYETLNGLWKAEIMRRRQAAQPEASER